MRVESGYRCPVLDADIVQLRSGDAVRLFLRSGGRESTIDVEGDVELCVRLIDQLKRDPSHLQSALQGEADVDSVQLAQQLDQLGWIADADRSGASSLSNARREIASTFDDAHRWLAEMARWADAEHGVKIMEVAHSALALQDVSDTRPGRSQLLLSVLLNSWRATSSPSRRLFIDALGLHRGRQDAAQANDQTANIEALDAADLSAIRNEVWAASLLLLETASAPGRFSYQDLVTNTIGTSGTNAMLLAENYLESALERTGGAARLFETIENAASGQTAARSIYLHQYFVTQRYVECVMNFLRGPLLPGLKGEGIRYLLDEVGHDDHERDACLSLGISDDEIRRFAPLPYFIGYITLLDHIALAMPAAFCMSVSVAEGMPGQRKRIADAITEAGYGDSSLQVHTDLDMELDHSRFPRRLMKQIPWIEGGDLCRYLQAFLTVLETSQLAWVQLARFAGLNRGKSHLIPFADSPDDLVKIIP